MVMKSIKIVALFALVWSMVGCVDSNEQHNQPVVDFGAAGSKGVLPGTELIEQGS